MSSKMEERMRGSVRLCEGLGGGLGKLIKGL